MSLTHWASIELTPNEEKAFARTAEKLVKFYSKEERDFLLEKIISSTENSFDYKKKVVLRLPTLSRSRIWGFRNLAGQDLYNFVEAVFTHHTPAVPDEDLNVLAANPAFAASHGKERDIPDLIFRRMPINTTKRVALRNAFILQLIANGTMDVLIAELVIATNRKRLYSGPEYNLDLNEAPIIEWARKVYGFDDSLPDNWVLKFLGDK